MLLIRTHKHPTELLDGAYKISVIFFFFSQTGEAKKKKDGSITD